MLNFYALAIVGLSAGTVGYLLGASKEWTNHRVTIGNYKRLIAYSNAVTKELSGLRTVGDESAVGSRHPSPVHRSHLQVVK